MRAKILIILMFAFLLSCKNSKITSKTESSLEMNSTAAVKETESSETNQVSTIDTESNKEERSDSDISTNDRYNDSLVFEETITDYSDPDSLGNQYPVRVTNRHAVAVSSLQSDSKDLSKTQKKQNSKQTEETEISITENSETAAEISSDFKEKKSEKTKEKIMQIPTRYLIWGSVILIIIIALFLFKRFGGFGWLSGVMGLIFK